MLKCTKSVWTKSVCVCVKVYVDKVCVDKECVKVYVDKVCVEKECVKCVCVYVCVCVDKVCVDKVCVDKVCVVDRVC